MLSPYSPFYCAHCIRCRLPDSSCVCAHIKRAEMPFPIMICCHPNEWQKNDNTANWAYLSSDDIERIKWHRKIERIHSPLDLDAIQDTLGHYLLFPSENAVDIHNSDLSIETLWVVDGTWQEAQKMLRQSPWLNNLPKVKIATNNDSGSEDSATKSQFSLRRNQRGLSTIEAISKVVSATDHCSNTVSGNVLNDNFHLFQKALITLKK